MTNCILILLNVLINSKYYQIVIGSTSTTFPWQDFLNYILHIGILLPFCAFYIFTGFNMMCSMELPSVLFTNLHTHNLNLEIFTGFNLMCSMELPSVLFTNLHTHNLNLEFWTHYCLFRVHMATLFISLAHRITFSVEGSFTVVTCFMLIQVSVYRLFFHLS